MARRKRRLTVAVMAERTGQSKSTHSPPRRGRPGVAMGGLRYGALGHGFRRGDGRSPRWAGVLMDEERLPRRVRSRITPPAVGSVSSRSSWGMRPPPWAHCIMMRLGLGSAAFTYAAARLEDDRRFARGAGPFLLAGPAVSSEDGKRFGVPWGGCRHRAGWLGPPRRLAGPCQASPCRPPGWSPAPAVPLEAIHFPLR